MKKSFEELLIEALSDEQKVYVDQMKKGVDEFIDNTSKLKDSLPDSYKDELKHTGHGQHDDLFEKHTGYASSERLISPISADSKLNPHPKVRTWLESNGFSTDKYSEKTTSRMETSSRGDTRERTYRIGAILQKHAPKHILKAFETDPAIAASNNEHQMVVTRNAYDIGGMTSGRHWVTTSCMRLPGKDASFQNKVEAGAESGGYDLEHYENSGGAYHSKLKGDFRHGSLVGYFTKKGDDTAENPSARTVFKKLVGTNKEGESHTIFRPESNLYGDKSSKFSDHAENFANSNWPAKAGFKYKMPNELYNDSGLSVTHHADGEHLHDNGVTAHYKDGVLHSPDNNTPSVSYGNGKSTTKEFHKNGKFHRDGDLPAQSSIANDKSFLDNRYFKHGSLHRDGDKPAEVTENGDVNTHKYFKYGIVHRDGDNPSHVIFNNKTKTPYLELYHKFGELHRDGDLPSYIDHQNGNVEYRKHGEYHRDGDEPAIITHNKGISNSTTQYWYKNGICTRDGGKPSTVKRSEDYGDGFRLEESFSKKNGEIGNDLGDHLPRRTITNIQKGYFSLKHDYIDGGEYGEEKSDNPGYVNESRSYVNIGKDNSITLHHSNTKNETEIIFSKDNEKYTYGGDEPSRFHHAYSIDHNSGTVTHNRGAHGVGFKNYKLDELGDDHKSIIREALSHVKDHIGFKEEMTNKILGEKK